MISLFVLLQVNANVYPAEALIARDYLGIQASSAETERLFSRAAQFLSTDRGALKPRIFETLMSTSCMLQEDIALPDRDWQAVRDMLRAEEGKKRGDLIILDQSPEVGVLADAEAMEGDCDSEENLSNKGLECGDPEVLFL